MKTARLIPVLALAVMAAGCATTTVNRDMLQMAARTYPVVVIGDFNTGDQLWQGYATQARKGLNAKLAGSKAFMEVIDSGGAPAPANAVVLSGKLTEADKGSTAARWLIGFGAGKAHITAEFQLAEPNGTVVGKFSVRKAYSGGAGIGGANLLDMDDLAQQLGEEAANTIVAWSKTGTLQSMK
jgi:uncharacterized protein DUF4410